MRILTEENRSFDLNNIPEDLNSDVHFAIVQDDDIQFPSLVYLEEFRQTVCRLSIGPYRVDVPSDWMVLAMDAEFGFVDMVEIKDTIGRGFHVLATNPFAPKTEALPLTLLEFSPRHPFVVPRVKKDEMFVIPLTEGDNPPCAFFAHKSRNWEEVNLDFFG